MDKKEKLLSRITINLRNNLKVKEVKAKNSKIKDLTKETINNQEVSIKVANKEDKRYFFENFLLKII